LIPRQNVRVPVGARVCDVLLDCVLLLQVGGERDEEQEMSEEGKGEGGEEVGNQERQSSMTERTMIISTVPPFGNDFPSENAPSKPYT
jgi:hypothetical protein